MDKTKLTLTQHLMLELDDYMQRANIRGPKARDRACADFTAGVLNTLKAIDDRTGTQHFNAGSVLALISLGGYPRVKQMADDLRSGQASLPLNCSNEEDK